MAIGSIIIDDQYLFTDETIFCRFWFDSSFGNVCRDCKVESRADVYFTLYPHLTAHHFHEFFADCQTQTRTAILTGSRSIYLTKGFEQAIHSFWRDTDTRIFYGKLNLLGMFVAAGMSQENAGIFASQWFGGSWFNVNNYFSDGSEFDSVAQQINENLAQTGNVTNEVVRCFGLDEVSKL